MIALLLLACTADNGDTGAPTDDTLYAPDERGPFVAGTIETIAPTDALDEDLPLQVWYPATEDDDEVHKYNGIMAGTAYEDVAADCSETRPVMVFSHGNTGMRFQSIFLTEHFASHGWIVVAPDHLGNTYFDYDDERMTEMVWRRPGDIAASFDALIDTIAASDGPLDGCVDASAGYAVVGHSFGGYTAFATAGAVIDTVATEAACEAGYDWLCDEVAEGAAQREGDGIYDLSDERVWAGVPMAPAGYEVLVGGLDQIDVPMMVMGGGRDTTTAMTTMVEPLYGGLATTPRHLVEIVDAGHYTFSDACALLPATADCSEPFIPPEDAHVLINAMTLTFLDDARGAIIDPSWLPLDDERVVFTTVE